MLKSVTTNNFEQDISADGKFIFRDECPYRKFIYMPESRGNMS